MSILELLGVVLVLSFVSFMVCRLWILFWDTIGKGLSYLNPFRKKKKITWYSLDESKVKEVNIDSVKAKDEQVYINEREW